MKAIAIIGANFGDEGKGRMTDHFAAQDAKNTIVVRYNGGPQAGHTVVTPDGTSHVFHHFGSGTLAGAGTYLSQFFLVNPLLWQSEYEVLGKFALNVAPFAPLTTPYDMFINREIENYRGTGRHGSCGYGVGETVERLCNSPHRLFVGDIAQPDFVAKVKEIRNKYVPLRLSQLGVPVLSEAIKAACASKQLLEDYTNACKLFYQKNHVQDTNYLKKFGTVLFEGSQGLGLDERHPFFPHVSRNKTGLTNVISICNQLNMPELEVVYVTRAYTTRHGRGPLPTEDEKLDYPDMTNVPNDWQGVMRFGHLDVDFLKKSIDTDFVRDNTKTRKTKSLAITCLDQIPDEVCFKAAGVIQGCHREDFPKILSKSLDIQQIYLSNKNSRSV